ncbi:uncharacterized protein LOC124154373 isoform X1 [Ischnura elegans]|uniref:uncharacterized protein LOC124154373 isoform X1 n=1 Tax=Ischnura elegans TaxID=197161 RepID=UPI001ED8B33C|nr:uncharacterized protein LOC124154373 isoform X1 [Ischnura elegans]
MASATRLIIFGAFLAIFLVVLCDPIPSSEDDQLFLQCRTKAHRIMQGFETCVANVYEMDTQNETRRPSSEEGCSRCKLICRNIDAILQCLRNAEASLISVSNKSQTMVPFLVSMLDESFHAVCENNADIMQVIYNEENKECVQTHWEACSTHLDTGESWHSIFFCDHSDPSKNSLTPKIYCQKIHTSLECIISQSEQCSQQIKRVVPLLLPKLRNSTTCSRYY